MLRCIHNASDPTLISLKHTLKLKYICSKLVRGKGRFTKASLMAQIGYDHYEWKQREFRCKHKKSEIVKLSFKIHTTK